MLHMMIHVFSEEKVLNCTFPFPLSFTFKHGYSVPLKRFKVHNWTVIPFKNKALKVHCMHLSRLKIIEVIIINNGKKTKTKWIIMEEKVAV